jgi:alanine dehydrogenase
VTTGPVFLGSDDVDRLCTVERALRAARTSARAAATTGRVQVADDVTWMRVLAGIIPELDVVGYKEFHRVGQRVRYHISLFRRSTADMIGIVDGRRITSLRTAATAALSFEHVDTGEAVELGVIGSGEEAKEGLRAVAVASSVSLVKVFSPTTANRESFAEEMAEVTGVEVIPVASADEALRDARRAYVATSASGPPSIRYEQVAHLELVAGIGSTRPNQRELVGDVIAQADRVVFDCDDARHEPGDVVEAIERYGFEPSSAMLLREWLDETPPVAQGGLTVFKSIGSVEQDLVLAHELIAAAHESGSGIAAPEIGSLRIMRD